MGKKIILIVIICLIAQTVLLIGLNYIAFTPEEVLEPPPLKVFEPYQIATVSTATDFENLSDYEPFFLNMEIAEDDLFTGSDSNGFSIDFVCEVEEKHFKADRICGGQEFLLKFLPDIVSEATYGKNQFFDTYQIKGHFMLIRHSGIHQGYISATLREVTAAHALNYEIQRNMFKFYTETIENIQALQNRQSLTMHPVHAEKRLLDLIVSPD